MEKKHISTILSFELKLEITRGKNRERAKSIPNESDLRVKLARNNGINFDFEIRQGKVSIRDAMSPLIR